MLHSEGKEVRTDNGTDSDWKVPLKGAECIRGTADSRCEAARSCCPSLIRYRIPPGTETILMSCGKKMLLTITEAQENIERDG